VSAFIDEKRHAFAVGPICRTLGVSASAYYQRASGDRSCLVVEDERLLGRIEELHAQNYFAYGYRRMWKALKRAGEHVGRDRVKRLMRAHRIQGAKRRGKPWRTTTRDPATRRAPDLVKRDFTATRPNALCKADILLPALLEGPRVSRLCDRCVLAARDRLAVRRPHAHRPRLGRAQDGSHAQGARR
jgi:hypothetical protein